MSGDGVRIRGIYSTAILRMLLDESIPIADISDVLKERFHQEIKTNELVPVVTIKDIDDKKGFIVYGGEKLSTQVMLVLRENIPEIVSVEKVYDQYSIHVVRILEKYDKGYIVELYDGHKGFLETDKRYQVGEYTIAYVASSTDDEVLLKEGISVAGKYVRLIENSNTRFSKFIRNPEKKTLLLTALTKIKLPPNTGVYFRSSANKASLSDIIEEIQQLINEFLQLKKKAAECKEPKKLRKGEKLFINFLPFEAKNRLDSYRSKQVLTLKHHHYIKSTDTPEKDCMDIIENIIDPESVCNASFKLIHLHLNNIFRHIMQRDIVLVHHWPSERYYTYSCKVFKISKPLIYCERIVSSSGFYDGLNIKKKSGDTITTVFAPFSPIIVHVYRRKNTISGLYFNINSPVELLSLNRFWYIDYHVDVIKTKTVKIIDMEKLEEIYRRGVISEQHYHKILNIVNDLKEKLINGLKPEQIIISHLPTEIYKIDDDEQ